MIDKRLKSFKSSAKESRVEAPPWSCKCGRLCIEIREYRYVIINAPVPYGSSSCRIHTCQPHTRVLLTLNIHTILKNQYLLRLPLVNLVFRDLGFLINLQVGRRRSPARERGLSPVRDGVGSPSRDWSPVRKKPLPGFWANVREGPHWLLNKYIPYLGSRVGEPDPETDLFLVGSGKFSPDPDPIDTYFGYVTLYKQEKNILKIKLLHIFR